MTSAILKKTAESKYSEKKYKEAALTFMEAARIAGEENNFLEAAELKNNASVAFLLAGDNQAAFDSAFNTEQVFLNAGNLKNAGMSVGNQAAALEAIGKNSQALGLYDKAAQMLEDAGEKELKSYIQKRSSSIKLKQGRYLESLASMEGALQNSKVLSPKEKILKKLSRIVSKLIQR
jgi:tetratricopeptide (TPR) repeat protein